MIRRDISYLTVKNLNILQVYKYLHFTVLYNFSILFLEHINYQYSNRLLFFVITFTFHYFPTMSDLLSSVQHPEHTFSRTFQQQNVLPKNHKFLKVTYQLHISFNTNRHNTHSLTYGKCVGCMEYVCEIRNRRLSNHYKTYNK